MARRRFSYPFSLAVVVATLIALTGGWIAWWNYRSGVDNVRSLASSMFDQISREAANETSSYLSRAPSAAEALVNLAKLDTATTASNDLAKRFEAVMRANPSFAWISYGHADGSFTGIQRLGAKLRTNQSQIGPDGKTTRTEHDIADDSTWTNQQTTTNTGYDSRNRPYYTLAVKANAGAWTPPYVFVGENVPGISYAMPSKPGGALAGVISIDFDLLRLSKLTRQLKFSPHGRVALVARDGVVLAHPTAAVVRPTVSGAPPELVKLDTIEDPAIRALLAAGTGATTFELDGDRYLARTLDISLGEKATGPQWQVLAYAPESDFTSSLRGRVITSLLISLVAVVLAVLVAWFLARRVSKPLIGLAQEMEKAGHLRLDDTTDHSSMFREIDQMNTALVQMKGGLRSFARYVPRDLVRTLVESGMDAELTGELRTLTIFFSDLEGFTSLAETKAPDELVRFLGEYFDDMSNIIAAESGTVDKYMGDGIMAFWGAPTRLEDHALKACAASLTCQTRVTELSKKGVNLRTRIGLATGVVLVGNIGSKARMNYTVMGDTANLASRIEGLNKQYDTNLMISQATFEAAGKAIVARPVDVVAVKGKTQGVPVYELLALATDKNADAERIAAESTTALEAYRARDFEKAAAIWATLVERNAADTAAKVMRDRALAYAASPPPPEWSGVHIAKSK